MKLIRVAGNDTATYGVLIQGTIPFALTLERPWLGNRRGESCIPVGVYTCQRVHSEKFGTTFEVTGVPSRDAILFHKGNIAEDSHGCILVGEQFNTVLGKPGISASKEGFAEFLSLTQFAQTFPLEIVRAY